MATADSDFSYLTALEVSGESTTRYVLKALRGQPALIVAPATDANPAYWDAVLALGQSHIRIRRGVDVSTKMLDEDRASYRQMFAKHVVRGWDGVLSKEGAVVPFSAEKLGEFLRLLPASMFDAMRAFAENDNNFRAEALAAEAVAKN